MNRPTVAHAIDPRILEPLRTERAAGNLRDVDLHLARHLLPLATGTVNSDVALTIARLSRAQADGDICLDLATQDERRRELLACGLAVTPESPLPTPLVIDRGHRLYLRKYFVFEQQVAAGLLQRATGAPLADAAAIEQTLQTVFAGADADPQQRAAVRMALERQLAVITGGPGTGKTTTVTRLLAAMLALDATQTLRIRLAAPTGKAAARLGESIRSAKTALHAATGNTALINRIPEDAQTLHRLLGTRPDTRRPRHTADNPLPLDILVIDEASMIDLPLMARVLAALPPQARLVLLGDSNQLASVEAGAMLGDLCAGIDTAAAATAPIATGIVRLRTSHRFHDDGGIGALARAVNAGDVDEAIAVCTRDAALSLNESNEAMTGEAVAAWRACIAHEDVGDAMRTFNAFRVLCALRDGPQGVSGVNARVERALAQAGLIDPRQRFYRGRPLLITENDYGLQLFNGDTGLVWPDADGVLRACFVAVDGSVRRIATARLPAHETCYAMTVHKAQGSEFERVLLLLPDNDSPVLGRELVYTGITRARTAVAIHAPRAVLAAAIGRRVTRSSGLRDALWGAC